MTSKLKCPFCQQELIREGMNHWWCSCNIEHQGKELYVPTHDDFVKFYTLGNFTKHEWEVKNIEIIGNIHEQAE